MSPLEILINYYIMLLSYIAPLMAVIIAIQERDKKWQEVAGWVTGFYSFSAGLLGFLEVSWFFTVLWLCIGIYRRGAIIKMLCATLVLAVLGDVIITDWCLDETYYRAVGIICGVTGFVDLKNLTIHWERFAGFAVICMKKQKQQQQQPERTAEQQHYSYGDE